MSRPTSDCTTRVTTDSNGGSPVLRIDGEAFAAVTNGHTAADGGRPRIVRWFETWSGVDR